MNTMLNKRLVFYTRRPLPFKVARNLAVVSCVNNKGIVELSLDRKEGKNSLSKQMLSELEISVSKIHTDRSARVVVIKSTVDKVFCAGADLKERATMPLEEVEGFVARLREAFQSIAKLPVPTIAAIDGAALGGGLELALACDIRIASEGALLGLPETALAIIPGAGGTQRLSRTVGIAKAKKLIFTGARLSAHEAEKVGLLSEVVLGKTCVPRALEIATNIAEKGPAAIRMAKKAIDEGYELTIEQGLNIERACYKEIINTKDRIEGLAAFSEKRKPNYIGE